MNAKPNRSNGSIVKSAMKMFRSEALVFVASVLTACAATIDATDRLLEPSALGEGEGLVFGSIQVTIPSEVADPDQTEMIDALKQRKLTATIRRYDLRGSGEVAWRDYRGDEFVVPCRADAEQSFVVRAPAGKYAVVELSDRHPGLFGDQPGCRIDDLASFEVHAGKTTYVGGLVVRVGFQSEEHLRWARLAQDDVWTPGFPERWLDMSFSVADLRETTLLDLDADHALAPTEIETELMRVGHGRWQFQAQAVPEPPKVPSSR